MLVRGAASAVIFLNDQNEILFLEPTANRPWTLPGGSVELGESPRSAAEREILEELGFEISINQILVIDYFPHKDSFMFIFFGGQLTSKQIAALKLQDTEIVGFQFSKLDLMVDLIPQDLYSRLQYALKALDENSTLYIEDAKHL